MRTTLDIDGKLLREAMVRARVRTKTEAVERGLQELINAERRRRLLVVKGYGMSLRSFLRSRVDE
jgi:Arc/MetJ family transcription regulator